MRDATWLFGGQVVGLVATFLATPVELLRMGAERYALVVLVSSSVGYFGVLELGLGWALMRYVPWHRVRGRDEHARSLVRTALFVSIVAGVGGGAIVWLLSGPIVGILRLTPTARSSGRAALSVAALIVPVMLVNFILAGLGRALGLFRFYAVLGAANVALLNLVWVMVAGDRRDVQLVVMAQLTLGLGTLLAWVWIVRRVAPTLIGLPRFHRSAMREMVRFGSLSAAAQGGIGLVVQLDKPALGTLLPVGMLPSYSIPAALAQRITLLSSSLVSAVFPRFAAALSTEDLSEVRRLRDGASRVVALGSGAIVAMALFAGRPFLAMWLGPMFAASAWKPLAVLAVGFGLLVCGSVDQSLLDARGRVGATALLTAAGGVVGLGSAMALVAVWPSTAWAATGMAVGLASIGLGALELSRRWVTGRSVREALLPILSPWAVLVGVAGAASWAASRLEAADLWHIVGVAIPTAAAALLMLCRRAPNRSGASQVDGSST